MLPLQLSTAGFLAFTWLFSIAAAQSSTVSFAYPAEPTGTTPMLIMNVVDTVVVQWKSNFKKAWLRLYCDVGTAGKPQVYQWAKQSVPANGNATYSPFFNSDVNRKWDRPYFCHFDLFYEDTERKGINGPVLNITSVASQKATTYALQYTTTGLPPSGTPPLRTIVVTAAPSATSGPTPPDSKPSRSSGLSTGATVGIAIGAVTGVIALLGLGFMVWRNNRKVKVLETKIPADHVDDYSKPQGVEVAQPYRDEEAQPYGVKPVAALELEPYQPPQELPGSSPEPNRP